MNSLCMRVGERVRPINGNLILISLLELVFLLTWSGQNGRDYNSTLAMLLIFQQYVRIYHERHCLKGNMVPYSKYTVTSWVESKSSTEFYDSPLYSFSSIKILQEVLSLACSQSTPRPAILPHCAS